MTSKYEMLTAQLRKLADINYASGLLQWDQEVYMPVKGAEIRAQQLATLSGLAHEAGSAPEMGELLNELLMQPDLSEKQKRNVTEALRNYNDRIKYTTSFVMEMSKAVSESFQLWQEAKKTNNFSLFAPGLEKLVKLKLQECEMLGYKDHPYDALLNQYEPGITTKQLLILFEEVRRQLVPFVKSLLDRPVINDDFTRLHYAKQQQWDFGMELLKEMGFDFDAGRQDISSHPFTINFNSRDVRVTTRINEKDMCEMIWSCIHEGGHALYEQGLPFEDYGLPSGEFLSLGIHESQSRLWENNAGRSLPFWKKYYPRLKTIYPEQLETVSLNDFYKAINKVEPSLIRTNADELTYHFHVMIRFELEVALMEGKIKVSDLPQLWNSKYKEYLGIDVPSDAQGVLQDVHWSHGSFGYFPTYSIGSFYAAQFYRQAAVEIPELINDIEKGNMKPLLDWLREKIHKHGRLYSSRELCSMVTGKDLDFNEFMMYAKEKYAGIYNL